MLAYYVSSNTFYVKGTWIDFTEGRKLIATYPSNQEVINTVSGYTNDYQNGVTNVYVKENNLQNTLSEVKLAIVSNKSLPDHAGQADEATKLISDRELHYWTLLQAVPYKFCTFTLLDSVDNPTAEMSPQIMNTANRPFFDYSTRTFVFKDNTSYLDINFPALSDQTYNVFSINPLIRTPAATLDLRYSIDDGVTWTPAIPYQDIKVVLQKLRLRISRNSGTLDNIILRGVGVLYNPQDISETAAADIAYINTIIMEDKETFDSHEITVRDNSIYIDETMVASAIVTKAKVSGIPTAATAAGALVLSFDGFDFKMVPDGTGATDASTFTLTNTTSVARVCTWDYTHIYTGGTDSKGGTATLNTGTASQVDTLIGYGGDWDQIVLNLFDHTNQKAYSFWASIPRGWISRKVAGTMYCELKF